MKNIIGFPLHDYCRKHFFFALKIFKIQLIFKFCSKLQFVILFDYKKAQFSHSIIYPSPLLMEAWGTSDRSWGWHVEVLVAHSTSTFTLFTLCMLRYNSYSSTTDNLSSSLQAQQPLTGLGCHNHVLPLASMAQLIHI